MLYITLAAQPAAAQHVFARATLEAGGQIGLPWQLDVRPSFRFATPEGAGGIHLHTTFVTELGLPQSLLAAVRFAPQSPVVAGRPDEWEAMARWQPLRQAAGLPIDVTAGAGFNGAARSVDLDVTLARWFGAVRAVGGGRLLSDAFGTEGTTAVLTAGAFLFPAPARLPVAVGAEAAAAADERVAWSASVSLGVPYSTHALGVFVTNTATGTLHGTSRGSATTRIGVGLNAPIQLGRVLGRVAPRQQSARVTEDAAAPAGVHTTIYRHDFVEPRIEVARGTVIEWTNRDAVVHTVTADDRAWDSGAIEPGESWRARFDEPGIYPYHCGPHPYMKGTVVVH